MNDAPKQNRTAPVIQIADRRRAPTNAARAWSQDAYAPLMTEGPVVDALRARLAEIAVELGHPPQLERSFEVASAGSHRFTLEPGVTIVRLISPPFEVAGDARRLGIAVTGVQIDDEVVPLTDLRLQQGFHDVEQGRALRWTDGNAFLVLDPVAAPRTLLLRVVAAAPSPS